MLLFSATLSPAFARARFALFLAATTSALFAATTRFVDRRPGAPGRFFPPYAALFVALFDVLCFSFLFAGIFRFAPTCHNSSLCFAFRRATRLWIYPAFSAIRAMTANGANLLRMNAFYNFIDPWLGLGAQPRDLTFLQISLRGIIVFLATLAMIRIGHKRSLARKTAFDAVLIVILASVLSRAINGSSAFFATIGGSVVIVLVHRLFAFIAYHSHWFGCLLKGRPEVIVENGNLVWDAMRRNHISVHDLEEDLRLDAQMEDASKVKVARVERSGDISFIKKE
jgi:Protein of unknown function (DUF421)